MSRAGRLALLLVYGASFAGIAWLAWRGHDYYLTPLIERPRHPDYWALKPGGTLGHLYGTVGSLLMVLMLVYTLRKRVPFFGRLGRLRGWLHFHIYCGIVGPPLVVLHSSFKVQGLVALSFWSMIVVAASGFVGRYLYAQLPRRRSGDELTLEEIRQESERLGARLREELGLREETLERLDRIGRGTLGERPGLARVLFLLPFDGLRVGRRLRMLRRRELGKLPDAEVDPLLVAMRRRTYLERRIRVFGELQSLFYYWHVLHKPLAIVMYLFMLVHVAVALSTGYGWGGGG